jgi:hypothetical protein
MRDEETPGFHSQPFYQPRNHRLLLTQLALLGIYGANGPPLGEMEGICHRKVDAWLDSRGYSPVSRSTLRRAKKALRQYPTPRST